MRDEKIVARITRAGHLSARCVGVTAAALTSGPSPKKRGETLDSAYGFTTVTMIDGNPRGVWWLFPSTPLTSI
jgi:hypothetical protein